jgi:hypothetical protein
LFLAVFFSNEEMKTAEIVLDKYTIFMFFTPEEDEMWGVM